MKTGSHILRLVFMNESFGFLIKDIPLGDWKLQNALELLRNKAKTSHNVIPVRMPVSEGNEYSGIRQALNLPIYLCSYGLADQEGAGLEPARYPSSHRVKAGWRLFPPDKPHVVTLGTSFGEQIRGACHSALPQGLHQGPRPHIRRAHWHSYWTGAKDTPERKLVPRWLPPIPVAMIDEDKPD